MLDPATITVLPIRREQLQAIPLRCWPEERSVLEGLFEAQETLGVAAWEGDFCVAQLHCYRLESAQSDCRHWPARSNWWSGRWRDALPPGHAESLGGPLWGLACFHVGRTLESMAGDDEPARGYMGRGIGTRMLMTAMEWALGGDYVAVIGPGAPPAIPAYAEWSGHMPRTTYEKLGFTALAEEPDVGDWVHGSAPAEVSFQVRLHVERGGRLRDLRESLMVKRLERA